jgi:hypothetical protein
VNKAELRFVMRLALRVAAIPRQRLEELRPSAAAQISAALAWQLAHG